MGKTKYMMSGGLAFSEDKDMERLRACSLNGWHICDIKFMGYALERGESTDYIYSVDYQTVNEEESEEYFDLFSAAGWTHITSKGDIHLFRATPGTKPIHSDRATVAVKHDNLGKSLKWLAISMLFMTVLVWMGALISTGPLRTMLAIIATILCIVSIPLGWTVMTIYHNKWKAKGKKGLVHLVKTIPFLFILSVAVIISVVVDNSGRAFRIFASMAIGAIAFPAAIWIIMSLYHKVRGNRV